MEEKLRFTLISLLLMLCGTMNFALAAIVNGVRQAPAPESTAFTTGSETDYFYLYNTTAGMFFTQGNSWGTRACVGPYSSAVKMYFAEPATPDGTYSIQNSVCIRNTTYSWKSASAEAAGHALYCDQSTSWGRPYWTVVPQDDNVFRLVNSAPYFADGEEEPAEGVQLFMGRDDAVAQDFGNAYSGFTDDSERFPVSDQLTATAGHHVDWVLVTPDAYAAVADAWPVYEKAKELKAAIDEAKEKSLNVDDEEAVYLEEASTIEQMDAAIASIKDKINHAAENTATPDNPADMTASITNASYDAGTKGWSGTAPAIGYTAAEFWQKNFNMYQDLTGLPNGVYAVKVKGYFRPGSTQDAYTKWATGKDLNAYLYAKAGEDSVAVALVNIFEGSTDQKLGVGTEYGPDGSANDGQSNYVPNNMQAGEAYFEAGRYQNIVFNAVDDGKLRIGLMKDDSNFSMNWTLFDQWELLYIGNSADAYKFWADEMKKNVKAPVIGEETIFTQSYQDAYNTIITQETTATNKAEAIAEIIEVEDAVAAIRKNIALWKELQSVLADAVAVVANEALDPDYTVELGDWVEWDAPDILEARTLTNAELEDLIAQKTAEIEEARRHPVSAGTDMTDLLINPGFEDARGATYGWTGFKSAYQIKYGNGSLQMPMTGGTATNTCAEAFSTTDFDLYQVVENAPVGLYEISVQGFYRNGRGDAAWNNYQNQTYYSQPGNFPVYVYLNDGQTPFVNVFSEPQEEGYYKSVNSGYVYVKDGMEFPDEMVSSAVAFSAGMYTQKAYGLVAKEGDAMRIGVKGTSAGLDGEDDNWVIFDNFKLTWKGFQADVIQPILEEELAKAYEKANEIMGRVAYEHLSDAIANAETALQGTEGKMMFNALSALYDAEAEAAKDMLLWEQLLTVIDDARAVVADHTLDPDYTSALADWVEFDVEDILATRELTNEQIEVLIAEKTAEIEEARSHPVDAGTDVTRLLTNPDFDDARGATYGWTGFKSAYQIKYGNGMTSYQMPTDGGTATNKCVEAFSTTDFDLYQVVENVPVGVYEISVQGFCRNGRGSNAWNNYQNQSYYSQPGNFPVYVYLNDAQTPFVNVFSEPVEEGYYKSVDSGSEVYVMDGMEFPDGMRSSAVAFSEGMYTQKAHGLVAKEGDVLRIGVKGTSAGLDGEDDNWVIFDNFKLTWKGFQPDVVEPILEEQIAKAENETILFAMDKDLYTRLINAIDAAKASINEGKGETMFNCLSNLYEIGAKVNESKLVFAELENANKNLANEIEVATEAGRTSALVDASTLNDQITSGIANHTIAEADINTLITDISSMISRLRMPDQDKIDNASDFAPVDMTSLIQNATYDEGVSGWLGTEAVWGGDQGAIAELFGKNYNYYQEFSGLPAGTYEVSVQAFYRSGSAENDYNTLGSVRNSRAFLYAAAINDTASVMNAKAIQRLASITENEEYIAEGYVGSIEESMEGYVVAHTDMIMDTDSGAYLRTFVPNMMGTANDQFMNGHFDNNKVIVKLAEGETLCIGLLKTTLVANDWTVFDNWRLTYFGRDSQLQPSGDERIFEIDDDIKGDANDDQQVTMSDVVAIVNYVLGRMNASFNFINADVNGNNEVTMADVVGVVNIVLGRNVSGARMAEPTTSLVPGTLTLNSKAGRLSVSLDNTSAYTAFQMDVTLPEGMSINDVAFTGRATSSHVLSMNTLENGKVRILGWSARNADLKGNSGELLTMDLSGIEMVGTVIVDNVLFVTADGMEHKLNAAEIYGETTGISQMENGQRTMDNSYDLQGRKVNSHLKKGLYIINNKKVVVK